MIWSKRKELAESFLANALQGRVKYHRTRYGPGYSYMMNRGWVTLDQNEIISCSTIKSIRRTHELTGDWYSNDAEALDQLHQQEIFTLNDFEEAIHAIIVLKIDEIISSEKPLIRAFAFFDRRLGKRRLKEMNIGENENPVVGRFFGIRCEAEGIEGRTA